MSLVNRTLVLLAVALLAIGALPGQVSASRPGDASAQAASSKPKRLRNSQRRVVRMAREGWVSDEMRGLVRAAHAGLGQRVRAAGGYRALAGDASHVFEALGPSAWTPTTASRSSGLKILGVRVSGPGEPVVDVYETLVPARAGKPALVRSSRISTMTEGVMGQWQPKQRPFDPSVTAPEVLRSKLGLVRTLARNTVPTASTDLFALARRVERALDDQATFTRTPAGAGSESIETALAGGGTLTLDYDPGYGYLRLRLDEGAGGRRTATIHPDGALLLETIRPATATSEATRTSIAVEGGKRRIGEPREIVHRHSTERPLTASR